MFTGLVQDIGTLRAMRGNATGSSFTIETGLPMQEVVIGDSIAVNGVCLTVTKKTDTSFTADASKTTLETTTFADVKVGAKVHLERALRVGDRLDGHMVQGHVDGVARIASSARLGESWRVTLALPRSLSDELVEKGSICVDGVSLTVVGLQNEQCELTIVPHSATGTLLTEYPVGHRVNVETDIIGKYVRKSVRLQGRSTSELLAQYGYTSHSKGK
ncbi:MAG: riboflavin synthase [Bradymonadia bacterium]